MKKILLLTLLVAISCATFAQSNIVPYQKKEGKKWGYQDSSTKAELYPCKFDSVTPFVGGVAKVKLKKKWGMLNESMEFVTPPIYSTMEDAEDNRYRVSTLIKGYNKVGYGYVSSTTGEVIIPAKYTDISLFENSSKRYAVVTLPAKSNITPLKGVIDWEGNEIVAPNYSFFGKFGDDGRAWANYLGKINGAQVHRGYHSIVDLDPSTVEMPNEKYFIIFSPQEAVTHNQRARIDNENTPDLYFSPSGMFNYSDNYSSPYYRNVDSEVTPDYNGYYFFTESYKYSAGVMTTSGEIVIPQGKYSVVSVPFDGVSLCYGLDKDGKRQYRIYNIAEQRETLIDGSFCWGYSDKMLRMVKKTVVGDSTTSTYFFYNLEGKKIGGDFDFTQNFYNNAAIVKKDKNVGVIDRYGQFIIPYGRYKFLGKYDEHNMILAQNSSGKVGYIDIDENIIVPFDYSVGQLFKFSMSKMAKSITEEGKSYQVNKYGVIDREQNVIIPFEWAEIEMPVYQGAKKIWVKGFDKMWSLFDLESQCIDPSHKFEFITKQYEQKITVVKAEGENMYAVVDNETGELLSPILKMSTSGKLFEIFDYYQKQGKSSINEIDAIRYFIKEKRGVVDYKISDVINTEDWDY